MTRPAAPARARGETEAPGRLHRIVKPPGPGDLAWTAAGRPAGVAQANDAWAMTPRTVRTRTSSSQSAVQAPRTLVSMSCVWDIDRASFRAPAGAIGRSLVEPR